MKLEQQYEWYVQCTFNFNVQYENIQEHNVGRKIFKSFTRLLFRIICVPKKQDKSSIKSLSDVSESSERITQKKKHLCMNYDHLHSSVLD